MVRFPFRWARASAVVIAVLSWAALGCGLATPAEQSTRSEGQPPQELVLARAELLLGWYPALHSILVFPVLGALAAAAVLLLREPASDFYRRTGPETAPDWSSFTPKDAIQHGSRASPRPAAASASTFNHDLERRLPYQTPDAPFALSTYTHRFDRSRVMRICAQSKGARRRGL